MAGVLKFLVGSVVVGAAGAGVYLAASELRKRSAPEGRTELEPELAEAIAGEPLYVCARCMATRGPEVKALLRAIAGR